jgi:hypothetical protein
MRFIHHLLLSLAIPKVAGIKFPLKFPLDVKIQFSRYMMEMIRNSAVLRVRKVGLSIKKPNSSQVRAKVIGKQITLHHVKV